MSFLKWLILKLDSLVVLAAFLLFSTASPVGLAGVDAQATKGGNDSVSKKGLFWKQRLEDLKYESRSGSLASKPYNQQLTYFSKMANGRDQLQFYSAVLDRMEKLKSPQSLPALESLINVKYTPWPTPSQNIAYHLRRRASKLWYEIKWADADEQEKIKTAFYGLSPGSPVRIYPHSSVEAVEKIGEPARDSLYQMLEVNWKFEKWDHVVLIGEIESLLRKPEFAPTEAEVNSILKQKGEFGKVVIMYYLAENKYESKAIPAVVDVLGSSQNLGQLSFVVNYIVVHFSQSSPLKRRKISHVLVELGDKLRDTESQIYNKYTYFSILSGINASLPRLGYSREAFAYMENYIKFDTDFSIENTFQYLKLHPRYLYSILGLRKSARKAAEEALSEWRKNKK